MKILNEKDFNDFINGYVLVDFYAEWCGPCKMIAPVLEQITSIEVGKVNVDDFQPLAQKYGVMSVPTLILFKNNEVISTLNGLNSLEDIEKWIQDNK